MGLERGAVCRRVGMRAPQHEQRARPSTRGVAREPAKATLRGLTSDVSQTTPSELGEAPVLPSHVSQGVSFQINILARSSMNTAVSTLGLAGAPPVQQLSPHHPQGPSGASFPPSSLRLQLPVFRRWDSPPHPPHHVRGWHRQAEHEGWILTLPLRASTSPSATRTRPEGC